MTPTRVSLARQLWAGGTAVELARRYCLSEKGVRRLLERYGLTGIPTGYVALSDLARDLGISRQALYKFAPERRHYGGRCVIAARDVPAVRARLAAYLPGEAAQGWLTPQEVARALGLNYPAFKRRAALPDDPCARIRRQRVLGLTGNAWRYHPQDVRALAAHRPIAPTGPVRGRLSAPALAVLIGADRTSVPLWCRAGMPHIRDRRGSYLIRPEEALAWLEAHPPRSYAPTRADIEARLREHLHPRESHEHAAD